MKFIRCVNVPIASASPAANQHNTDTLQIIRSIVFSMTVTYM